MSFPGHTPDWLIFPIESSRQLASQLTDHRSPHPVVVACWVGGSSPNSHPTKQAGPYGRVRGHRMAATYPSLLVAMVTGKDHPQHIKILPHTIFNKSIRQACPDLPTLASEKPLTRGSSMCFSKKTIQLVSPARVGVHRRNKKNWHANRKSYKQRKCGGMRRSPSG